MSTAEFGFCLAAAAKSAALAESPSYKSDGPTAQMKANARLSGVRLSCAADMSVGLLTSGALAPAGSASLDSASASCTK